MSRRRFLYQGASVLGGIGLFAVNPPVIRGAVSASNKNSAPMFGVYEVVLTGDGGVANPFDTVATVKFVPPSGEVNARTVHAFFDGDNSWRARVYVSEPGKWKWRSTSADDQRLGGSFEKIESANANQPTTVAESGCQGVIAECMLAPTWGTGSAPMLTGAMDLFCKPRNDLQLLCDTLP